MQGERVGGHQRFNLFNRVRLNNPQCAFGSSIGFWPEGARDLNYVSVFCKPFDMSRHVLLTHRKSNRSILKRHCKQHLFRTGSYAASARLMVRSNGENSSNFASCVDVCFWPSGAAESRNEGVARSGKGANAEDDEEPNSLAEVTKSAERVVLLSLVLFGQ